MLAKNKLTFEERGFPRQLRGIAHQQRLAGRQRRHGVLAVERLNLDFLLDAKYPHIVRRIQYRPMMSAILVVGTSPMIARRYENTIVAVFEVKKKIFLLMTRHGRQA